MSWRSPMEPYKVVRDLQVGAQSYGLEEATAVIEVLKNGAPTHGPKVHEFEGKFSKYIGVKYAVTCTSGGAALHLATIAAGIGHGDEVLVPSIPFPATASLPAFQGAKVRFIDVVPQTLEIDPKKVEASITEKTKAIYPVHLYGQPVEMDAIMDISEEHDLIVIEDCAHAVGAEYKGRKAGSIGHIGIFSFHQAKIMSTLGEGGMLTTNIDECAEKAHTYSTHGFIPIGGKRFWKMRYPYTGLNYRMTDAQAAVGLVKLEKLDIERQKRRRLANHLSRQLEGIDGLTLPFEKQHVKHAWSNYAPVFIDKEKLGVDRDEFLWKLMTEEGIHGYVAYPSVELEECYQKLGHKKGECPIAEELSEKIATLPLHSRLSNEDIDYMAEAIKKIVS